MVSDRGCRVGPSLFERCCQKSRVPIVVAIAVVLVVAAGIVVTLRFHENHRNDKFVAEITGWDAYRVTSYQQHPPPKVVDEGSLEIDGTCIPHALVRLEAYGAPKDRMAVRVGTDANGEWAATVDVRPGDYTLELNQVGNYYVISKYRIEVTPS